MRDVRPAGFILLLPSRNFQGNDYRHSRRTSCPLASGAASLLRPGRSTVPANQLHIDRHCGLPLAPRGSKFAVLQSTALRSRRATAHVANHIDNNLCCFYSQDLHRCCPLACGFRRPFTMLRTTDTDPPLPDQGSWTPANLAKGQRRLLRSIHYRLTKLIAARDVKP